MDLVFNRKVVKPIRGGGATPYQNPHQATGANAYRRNDGSNSRTRQNLVGVKHQPRHSVGNFMATPMKSGSDVFGAPLIKPEFQKKYNE